MTGASGTVNATGRRRGRVATLRVALVHGRRHVDHVAVANDPAELDEWLADYVRAHA